MEEINKAVTFNILDKNIERHRSFKDDFENMIETSPFKEWFQTGGGQALDLFNLTAQEDIKEDIK